MTDMETLRTRYRTYEKKAQEVRSKASAFAGAFNMGDDPRQHSCHEEFYDDVAAWVQEFLATEPTARQAEEVVRWILEAAAAHRNEDVYWYMYAAQSHTTALIPLLSAEDSAGLAAWYDDAYPVLDRMPAQKEVYRLLKRQGKEDLGKQPGIFSFLRKKK